MTTEKSPISILQELAQIKRIPVPMYDVELKGKIFRVTLRLGQNDQVFAEGLNINKKLAKQLCAENAIEQLKLKNVTATLSSPKPTFINVSNCNHYNNNYLDKNANLLRRSSTSLNSLPSTIPFNNYVGKLNEICSKKMLEYPAYRECGISNCEFVIECKIFDNTCTQGRGKTKKDAKQQAAEAMLKLLTESNDTRCEKLMESTKIVDRLSKLHLNEIVHDKVDVEGSQRMSLVKLDTDPMVKRSDISSINHMNEEQLKMELGKLNVTYRIINLYTGNNVTLILKTKPSAGHKSHTFIATNGDEVQGRAELLRRTVFGMRILLNN